MIIKDATFLSSFYKVEDCPNSNRPEFAFIGRSNVGKSSLINMLTGRRNISKVSVTPGKTRLINFFTINDDWFLVDLPGYGYARVSKSKIAGFSRMIENYLLQRNQLVLVFILIDSRHELQNIDREFINWCGENGLPFALVFTKVDKLSKGKVEDNINKIKKELLKEWSELPPYFITSSENKIGREELLDYINQILKDISKTSKN